MTFTNGFGYGEQKIPLSFKNDGDCDLAFTRYHDYRTKYWELFAERCIYGEQKSIKFVGKYGINTSSIPDNFWRWSNLFFSDLDEIVYIAYREKINDDYYYGWVSAYAYIS